MSYIWDYTNTNNIPVNTLDLICNITTEILNNIPDILNTNDNVNAGANNNLSKLVVLLNFDKLGGLNKEKLFIII